MKPQAFAFLVSALALGASLTASRLSLAADAPAKATAKDVSARADEAARAVREYTVQQRDEAVKQAKAALDDLDARIRRMETKIDREWDGMDEAARKKARTALDALHRERNEAAEWYGGLRHGSAEAWDQVKDGFVKSYERLKKSFVTARKAL
jgi:small-conductance mechanosensitive channel